MTFRRDIQDYVHAPLTHQIVSDVLAAYRRPNDKINDLVQSGLLISLRRGLYVPGPELDLPLPHAFVIANHLRGPSYVSLETALDRKSTRLNSSHVRISYAVFCLKKKTTN